MKRIRFDINGCNKEKKDHYEQSIWVLLNAYTESLSMYIIKCIYY